MLNPTLNTLPAFAQGARTGTPSWRGSAGGPIESDQVMLPLRSPRGCADGTMKGPDGLGRFGGRDLTVEVRACGDMRSLRLEEWTPELLWGQREGQGSQREGNVRGYGEWGFSGFDAPRTGGFVPLVDRRGNTWGR